MSAADRRTNPARGIRASAITGRRGGPRARLRRDPRGGTKLRNARQRPKHPLADQPFERRRRDHTDRPLDGVRPRLRHRDRGRAVVLVSAGITEAPAIDDVRTGHDVAACLVAAVHDLGLASARLGLAGSEVLPWATAAKLQGEFPKLSFEAADVLLAQLRLTVSAAECDLLRSGGHRGHEGAARRARGGGAGSDRRGRGRSGSRGSGTNCSHAALGLRPRVG